VAERMVAPPLASLDRLALAAAHLGIRRVRPSLTRGKQTFYVPYYVQLRSPS